MENRGIALFVPARVENNAPDVVFLDANSGSGVDFTKIFRGMAKAVSAGIAAESDAAPALIARKDEPSRDAPVTIPAVADDSVVTPETGTVAPLGTTIPAEAVSVVFRRFPNDSVPQRTSAVFPLSSPHSSPIDGAGAIQHPMVFSGRRAQSLYSAAVFLPILPASSDRAASGNGIMTRVHDVPSPMVSKFEQVSPLDGENTPREPQGDADEIVRADPHRIIERFTTKSWPDILPDRSPTENVLQASNPSFTQLEIGVADGATVLWSSGIGQQAPALGEPQTVTMSAPPTPSVGRGSPEARALSVPTAIGDEGALQFRRNPATKDFKHLLPDVPTPRFEQTFLVGALSGSISLSAMMVPRQSVSHVPVELSDPLTNPPANADAATFPMSPTPMASALPDLNEPTLAPPTVQVAGSGNSPAPMLTPGGRDSETEGGAGVSAVSPGNLVPENWLLGSLPSVPVRAALSSDVAIPTPAPVGQGPETEGGAGVPIEAPVDIVNGDGPFDRVVSVPAHVAVSDKVLAPTPMHGGPDPETGGGAVGGDAAPSAGLTPRDPHSTTVAVVDTGNSLPVSSMQFGLAKMAMPVVAPVVDSFEAPWPTVSAAQRLRVSDAEVMPQNAEQLAPAERRTVATVPPKQAVARDFPAPTAAPTVVLDTTIEQGVRLDGVSPDRRFTHGAVVVRAENSERLTVTETASRDLPDGMTVPRQYSISDGASAEVPAAIHTAFGPAQRFPISWIAPDEGDRGVADISLVAQDTGFAASMKRRSAPDASMSPVAEDRPRALPGASPVDDVSRTRNSFQAWPADGVTVAQTLNVREAVPVRDGLIERILVEATQPLSDGGATVAEPRIVAPVDRLDMPRPQVKGAVARSDQTPIGGAQPLSTSAASPLVATAGSAFVSGPVPSAVATPAAPLDAEPEVSARVAIAPGAPPTSVVAAAAPLQSPAPFAVRLQPGRPEVQPQDTTLSLLAGTEGGAPVSPQVSHAAPAGPGALAHPAAAVVQQLVHAIGHLAHGQIEVSLSPEELGRVRLTMIPGENSMLLSIQADRTDTLALLRRNIDQLASDLRDLGYANLSFQFGSNQSDGGRHDRGNAVPRYGFAEEAVEPTGTAPVASSPALSSDRLDLRL